MGWWIDLILAAVLVYLGLGLGMYWAPVWAVRFRALQAHPRVPADAKLPTFLIVSACRDGAPCIPGLAQSFREQDYPADRFRLMLVADHCADNSAQVARSLGMGVYERKHPQVPGKGNAISEVLARQLHEEAFDVLVVLDVDARVERSFLRKAAAYFQGNPIVLSCATFTKNPDQTLLAHVGDLIQALLRFNQEGRAALGLDAILYGSHGYALAREVLDRLDWRTTNGLVAEDMELRLRSTLAGFPIVYAPDLHVYNDVTVDAASVHSQRLRWNATYPPLIIRYALPLLRGGLWEALWGVLLIPTFANLFLYLTLAAGSLTAWATAHAVARPYAATAVILWAADVIYFFTVFKMMKIRLGLRELQGFAQHLAIRAWALVGGLFLMHVKDWAPAPHPPEQR